MGGGQGWASWARVSVPVWGSDWPRFSTQRACVCHWTWGSSVSGGAGLGLGPPGPLGAGSGGSLGSPWDHPWARRTPLGGQDPEWSGRQGLDRGGDGWSRAAATPRPVPSPGPRHTPAHPQEWACPGLQQAERLLTVVGGRSGLPPSQAQQDGTLGERGVGGRSASFTGGFGHGFLKGPGSGQCLMDHLAGEFAVLCPFRLVDL